MNALSNIWEKLRDKAYRDAFVSSQLKRGLPTQIRVMLKDRGWNQGDLAERSGLKQGAISRAADPDYGNLTINTVLKIASGFDVAYVGRFVPFSDLARWYTNLSESALSAPSFETDAGFIERKVPATASQVSASKEQWPLVAATGAMTPYMQTIGMTNQPPALGGGVIIFPGRRDQVDADAIAGATQAGSISRQIELAH